MNNESNDNILLYQPKVLPTDLLRDIKNLCDTLPLIEKAFYCRSSILIESTIIENNIIGLEIVSDTNIDQLKLITTASKQLLEQNKDLRFVIIHEQPFKRYFSKEVPFYKKITK